MTRVALGEVRFFMTEEYKDFTFVIAMQNDRNQSSVEADDWISLRIYCIPRKKVPNEKMRFFFRFVFLKK